ncbi:hypothetical protein JG687_00010029 [Phytophthora cactorum]|uniref:Uncharacterized protein n=1 Tax=Phytophthora cactorum TaxID=29920 RepID=A0A8T1UDE6_9STRA|nr:hypothetical protein GQ600_743 [Phytophthora cactorum]KAG6957361.1 hypothetical protein JG687_00010029 [Phytophthora cactorum]
MESKHEYTQGEKRMIVHSFDYFKGLKDQKIFKGMMTRKLVADCLVVAAQLTISLLKVPSNAGMLKTNRKQGYLDHCDGNFNDKMFEKWFERLRIKL